MGSGVSKAEVENKYAKKTDLNNLAKSTELENYLKSSSLPDNIKTFIQGETENGTLDSKIKDFKYIKQKDLSARIGELNLTTDPAAINAAVVAAIQANTAIQTSLARTMAQDSQLQTSIGGMLNSNPTFASSVTSQLTTAANIKRISDEVARSSELPSKLATEIEQKELIKTAIANKIIASKAFKDDVVGIMSSSAYVDLFRGESGGLDAQTIEDSVKTSVMWCADGEMCEIPKANAARNKKGASGIKLDTNQYVQGLKLKANDPIDFAQDIEASETIKSSTRGKNATSTDGTIVARFDNSGTGPDPAKKSALEIHGIGKHFSSDNKDQRNPKQVKIFDNLDVNGRLNVTSWPFFNGAASCAGWAAELKKMPKNTMTFGVADTGMYFAYKDNDDKIRQFRLQGQVTDGCGSLEELAIAGNLYQRGDNIVFDHPSDQNRWIIHAPQRKDNQGLWIAKANLQGEWLWQNGQEGVGNVVRYGDNVEIASHNGYCVDAGSHKQGCDWNNVWKLFNLRRKP